MTCDEFWNGATDSPDHLTACPACAARFARQEELAAGLKALGAQSRRLEAPPRVERRLLAALRGERALRRPRERGAWWLAGAWAMALAATVLIAVTLMRPHEPQRTRRNIRNLTQLATVETTVDADSTDAYTADGEFLPLANAEAIAPNEAVDLVRIEVPRSAMIPLGFDVPAERAGETVEADVMLDADGVARAVRFLDPEKTARESTW